MAESIRVVVLKDGDLFYAQCLEIDIAAQGSTEAEALTRLRSVFEAEKREAAESGRSLTDIGKAPEAFHAIFNADAVSRTNLAA